MFDYKNSPLGPLPMSPIGAGPTAQPPQPLAGAGALDPRVKNEYERYKQMQAEREAALDENAPQDVPLWKRGLTTALPILGAGIASGFLPMAAAFAIGAVTSEEAEEAEKMRAWDEYKSKTRFDMQGQTLDAAQGVFGSPGATSANQFGPQVGKVGDKFYWFRFNKATGQMENTGVEAQGHRDNASGWLARYQQYSADPSNPPLTPEQFYEKFEAPAGVQVPIKGSEDSRMTEGTEKLSGAEQRGKLSEQEIFERRQYVETGMDVVGDLENSLGRSMEILAAVESGRIGEAVPLVGRITQYFDESAAMLAAEATSQALQNLQIVNLAPVTEKEFAELKKMFADIAAGQPANVGRIRASIQRIQRELTKAKQKINRRASRGLGDDFVFDPYPINEGEGIKLFPDQPSTPKFIRDENGVLILQ